MKKIISIILAIALLAVPFCGINASAADEFIGKELVLNGGFNNNGENWTLHWGPATIINADSSFAGNRTDACLQIPNYSGGASSNSFELKGGYIYTLSFLIAARDGTLGKNLVIVSIGNLLNETYKSVNFNYERVTYTFECKEDTTANIRFNRQDFAGGAGVCIDDVSLVATESTDPAAFVGKELVADGGFDNDFGQGWTRTGWDTTNTSIGAVNGNRCLDLKNWGEGARQDISFRGGYIYKLTFDFASEYVQGETNGIRVSLGDLIPTETIRTTNYNYVSFTYEFECKENVTTTLKFLSTNDTHRTQHIDNVSIVAVSTINDYYAKYLVSELVTNGDFSNGNTGWTIAGGGAQDNPEDANIKEFSIWWGESGSASTDITVEAGKTYDVSFTYRKGNTAPLTYSVIQNDETIYEGAIAKEHSENVHTKATFKFTAAADGVAAIKFASQPYDTLTAFSNVSVVPAVSAASENLVGDSTLEDPKANGWTLGWNTSAYNDAAGSVFGTANNNMIKFGDWASPVWTDISVVAGQTYKISFDWAPYWHTDYGNTNASIAINIYDKNDNANSIFSTTELSKSKTAYKVEYNFTSTFTGTATVRLGRDGGHQWWVTYVDNVAVYPMTYENAVVNGTFETAVAPAAALGAFAESADYYGWCLDGAAEISDTAKNGAKALKVANTDGAYATAYVANPKNALAFNYKGEADSSAKVVVSSDFEGTNVLATKDVVGTGDWAEYVVDTDLAVGKVYIHIVSNQGTNYFDDVSIISYELIADKDFAPKSDEKYFYDVSGADIKAGYKGYNAELAVSSDGMKTGVKATLSINGKFTAWEKEIVVEGDANGDGVSSVHDLVAAKKQASGVDRLSGAYLRAVTANENGEVQGYDLSVLRSIILKKKIS